MFGKNRDAYVQKDVYSDDEDMEADARVLEREEYERLVLHLLMFSLGVSCCEYSYSIPTALALLREKMKLL